MDFFLPHQDWINLNVRILLLNALVTGLLCSFSPFIQWESLNVSALYPLILISHNSVLFMSSRSFHLVPVDVYLWRFQYYYSLHISRRRRCGVVNQRKERRGGWLWMLGWLGC